MPLHKYSEIFPDFEGAWTAGAADINLGPAPDVLLLIRSVSDVTSVN